MIVKLKRFFKVLKWNTWIPIIAYLLFITIILSLTFPNNKAKTATNSNNVHNKDKDDVVNSDATDYSLKEDEISEPIKKPQQAQETVILADPKHDGSYILKFAFKKADSNSDSYLTVDELAKYINLKISDHIDTSIKRNPQIFSEIDRNPIDGLVSWEEYHVYFLRKIGLDESYISNHNEKKHIKLDRKAKEQLMKDKANWQEASRNDPDSLTLDEFLAFQHPEASPTNLLNLVDDILRLFDDNGDEMLTVDEFTNNYSTSNENKKLFVTDDLKARREEFNTIIDRNKDGKADRNELLNYVDWKNPRHAMKEALTLFSLSDTNKDNRLSLEEMLNKTDLFMTSKMIATMENFHDEF